MVDILAFVKCSDFLFYFSIVKILFIAGLHKHFIKTSSVYTRNKYEEMKVDKDPFPNYCQPVEKWFSACKFSDLDRTYWHLDKTPYRSLDGSVELPNSPTAMSPRMNSSGFLREGWPLGDATVGEFVELPKTTHLPKTTENHLENHIYRGILPS